MDQSNSVNNNLEGNRNHRSVSTQTPDWRNRVTVMEAPTQQELQAALALCQMSERPIVFGSNGLGAPIPEVNSRADPRGLVWEPPAPTPSAPNHPANPEPQARAQRSERRPLGWVRLRPADHDIGQASATMTAREHNPPQAGQNPNTTTPEPQCLSSLLRGPAAFALHRPGFAREESFLPEDPRGQSSQQADQNPYPPGNTMHNASRMDLVPTDLFSERTVGMQRQQRTKQTPDSRFPRQIRRIGGTGRPDRTFFSQATDLVQEPQQAEQNPYSNTQVQQGNQPQQVVVFRKPFFNAPAQQQADQSLYSAMSQAPPAPTVAAKKRTPLPDCPLRCSKRDDHIRKKHSRCHICGDFFPHSEDVAPHLLSAHGLTLAQSRASANREAEQVDQDETEDEDEDEE
ncbi:hypothetical protein DL98DRAFT_570185 [Cadophora sp. DSE1049]|nr:hypothetical protein DL98DRAFT_570185 [Cadophora sp. DSE1049]